MEYIIDGVNFDTADRDSHIYLKNLFILFISLINVLWYDLFRTNGCQVLFFISDLLQSIEKNFLTQENKRRIKFLLYKNWDINIFVYY